jgi:phosphate transport system permease protein
VATALPLPTEVVVGPDHSLIDHSWLTRWRVGVDAWMGRLLPLLFLVAVIPILSMIYYISSRALPTLTWEIITSTSPYQTDSLGVPLIGTAEIMLIATSLAILLGFFGGIATAELLSERIASWIRLSTNVLVGTPSVILGYFGYFAFVLYFGWGLSLIAGAVTLAFFMTPYIFRTVDLAFTSVPPHIKDAALGSGASAGQYIRRVAFPIAFPQVLTGIFLALAIGVGETAPLVLTTTAGVIAPQSLFSPVTFLTGLIWANFTAAPGSGLIDLAFQAAFLLLVIVVVLNVIVRLISYRYEKRLAGLYQ